MLAPVHGEFRLAADPQLRFAASGVAVVNLRLVASSRKKEGDEWVDDKTLWLDATAFKKTAENIAETLAKSDLVVVIGKLQTDEWEQDGQKRSKNVLIIDHIGPSLAWKTATLHETERGSSTQASQPASNAAPAQSDEPPF